MTLKIVRIPVLSDNYIWLVHEPESGETMVVDPAVADAPLAEAEKRGWKITQIWNTHWHPDHTGGNADIQAATGCHITGPEAEKERIPTLDTMVKEGDTVSLGDVVADVIDVPAHTAGHIAFHIPSENVVFVGDTLFMPDYGTARCDFPGGDARVLYQSIQKVLALPPETRIFLCHDYKAPDRDEYQHMTTVAEQRQANVHVHDGVSEEEFVKMRTERDATLDMPRLILPSVQVNMRAGHMPPAEDNGQVYLKVPVNLF
mgnify:CR=1 FL=1